MKKDNFDEELRNALQEYVQNSNYEITEKVKFSKKHKAKMNKLFEDVREGKRTSDKSHSHQFNVNKFIKVAVFILIVLFVTVFVAPNMMAWRKGKLGIYGEKQEEHSWTLPNDTSEILENNPLENEEYINVFGYLPEGYIVDEIRITENSQYIKLKFANDDLTFKVSKSINQASDTEGMEVENIVIDDKNMIFMKKNTNIFIWSDNVNGYRLYSELAKEELIKVIENINYDEIENFF